MRYLSAWIAWFMTPDYADYNTNPIVFWIQVVVAGSLYAFAFMGLVSFYLYITDGQS